MPSTNGDNGRDASGRFAKGNAGGPGNPHAKRVAQLHSLIVESVTDDDLTECVKTLVRCAKAGEPWAVREIFDRCVGKAMAAPVDGGEVFDGKIEIVYVQQPLPESNQRCR